MSTSAERAASGRTAPLAVDRVACSAHGVCAQLLTGVTLDEWGYPVVDEARVAAENDADAVARAVRLCPARALYRR
ncbi:ferredoxin [Terrabacter sp. NPDC080008]|uniref:ferredoxin n=1 Tax=Terrabacter sp. NPDC080008 TaxID=3155176 RepID=UPI00345056C7